MNYRIVCKYLGVIALLIAVTMLFSLPWAYPNLGQRAGHESAQFENQGFYALSESILICVAVGLLLVVSGGKRAGPLYHKEAMAVVGFTWILATVLGALPFYLSSTGRGPAIRMSSDTTAYAYDVSWYRGGWRRSEGLTDLQQDALKKLLAAGNKGISAHADQTQTIETLLGLIDSQPVFRSCIEFPDDAQNEIRVVWIRMSFVDALFESQSGFSTTGATVISDLEDATLVPHCILFWRSSTHFLGGLGIIVLFVAILGQGSAGKALMRNEVPGPHQESSEARMQHTAQVFAGIYIGLTLTLVIILKLCGLSMFDAFCHSFGTMATGGFSTYNASLGHFDSTLIESVVIVFMLFAGMNFTLLYFLFRGMPSTMFRDVEWKTYMWIVLIATILVVVSGLAMNDFGGQSGLAGIVRALRYGLFQVVSIITTTGYGTHDFDGWNNLGRCILFVLMFVGGCAGSTGGGIKVIRWLMMTKMLGLEFERAHHPRVVRTLRLGGKPIDDPKLRLANQSSIA